MKLSILVLAALLYGSHASATELAVYFDSPENHSTAPIAEPIVQGYVNPAQMRRFDVDGSLRGYRHRNVSRDTIRSIRLRITDDRDRFTVVDGGDLFPFAEIRDEGKEVIFAGANIPRREYVWSRFPNRNRSDSSRIFYLGEALTEDLTPDSFAAEFFQTSGDTAPKEGKLWRSAWNACPSIYRRMDASGQSADNTYLCIFSRGIPLVYNNATGEISEVQLQANIPDGRVTRISWDADASEFVLWNNWKKLAQLDPENFESATTYRSHRKASAKTPAAKIPIGGPSDKINRAYFVRQKIFNLKKKVFTQVFFDSPRAHVVVNNATFLGSDKDFYYFKVTTFGSDFEWALSVQPEGSFRDHTIWSRRAGNTEWRQDGGTVVMAEIRK